jgi:hypothetical protein
MARTQLAPGLLEAGRRWHTSVNPSFSVGRDQEDRSSKPAWANSSETLILKKKNENEKQHKKRVVKWLKW